MQSQISINELFELDIDTRLEQCNSKAQVGMLSALATFAAAVPTGVIGQSLTVVKAGQTVPTAQQWSQIAPFLSAYASLLTTVRDVHSAHVHDVVSLCSERMSHGSDTSSVGNCVSDTASDSCEPVVDISVDVAELALREEDSEEASQSASTRSRSNSGSTQLSIPSPKSSPSQKGEEDSVIVFPASGRQVTPTNALITTRSALLRSHETTTSNGSISPCGHFKRNRVSNQRKTRNCVCGHCNMQWVEVNIRRLNNAQQRSVLALTSVAPFDDRYLPADVVRDIGLARPLPVSSFSSVRPAAGRRGPVKSSK